MGKALAIDFGLKRTGLAETDDLKIIASGLITVETPELFSYLDSYLEKNNVEVLVVGESKTLDNQFNAIESDILIFIKKFQKTYPAIQIARIDERFTSKIAFDTIIQGGLSKSKRRNKALVDQISATIILQSYLEKI